MKPPPLFAVFVVALSSGLLSIIQTEDSTLLLQDIQAVARRELSTISKPIANVTIDEFATIILNIIEALNFVLNLQTLTQTSICYGDVGCFNKTHNSYIAYLPSNDTPTSFYLTTTDNPNGMESLTYNDIDTVHNSSFIKECKSFFLIHGYRETLYSNLLTMVKDTLLQKESCANVILVIWNQFENANYLQVSINAELVGRRAAVLINNFVLLGANISKVHIIGFSMGAQIAGYAGKFLQTEFGLLVGQISGLDPAGPLFCYLTPLAAGYHLNSSQAQKIDVIHTNSGVLILNQLGCLDLMGHVDFFPNGGQLQPCATTDLFYSHSVSVYYYNSSISGSNDCTFRSFPAEREAPYSDFVQGKIFDCAGNNNSGCSVMGYPSINYNGTGKQYLMTLSDTPFFGSQIKFVVSLQMTSESIVTPINIRLTDGNIITNSMLSLIGPGENTFVSISNCSYFNFSNVLYAQLSLVGGNIQTLAVTNELGESKHYCQQSPLLGPGPSNTTVELQNQQCGNATI